MRGLVPLWLDPWIGADAINPDVLPDETVYPSDTVIRTESEHPGIDYTNFWILLGVIGAVLLLGRKKS